MASNKKAVIERMMKGMAFIGGSLQGIDNTYTYKANDWTKNSDYRADLENTYNYVMMSQMKTANTGTPIQVPNYQPIAPEQVHSNYNPQYNINQHTYYQPIQQVEIEDDMPDIDKYLGKKKKKTVAPVSGNPVLDAVTNPKSPIVSRLEMLCAIMGEVYQAQMKTNALLTLSLANQGVQVDDELIDEEAEDEVAEEVANIQQAPAPAMTFEEEAEELAKMSAAMAAADNASLQNAAQES